MILFSKPGCKKCEYVKEAVDLEKLGVEVVSLTPPTKEALSELAYHECVALSETTLPILILDDGEVVTGAIIIKNYLLQEVEKQIA